MNAPIVPGPVPARGSGAWLDDVPAKLLSSLEEIDWHGTQAYRQLDELADRITIDGYSMDIDSAIVQGPQWTVPGTIFVDLIYDANSDEPVTLDDAYPIEVQFHLDGQELKIDSVTADTSSFYE